MYGGMYYPGFYFDPTYILILIGALLSMWASARVKSTEIYQSLRYWQNGCHNYCYCNCRTA